MLFLDFSNYELSGKMYGGTERKLGILIGKDCYMLKFPKKTAFGFRHNVYSEYIGSHIYQMLGIQTQDTYIGKYKEDVVVACKDFVVDGYQFVPFNDVGESSIEEDKEKYQYSYEDIVSLLTLNKKITNVEDTISSFFEIYIVDALLGNFDRHGGNWGFLKKDNKYILAPVFDNGSCLYPNMVDEDEMMKVINDEEQINARVYDFPTSQIQHNSKKSSYFEVICSLKYKEINKALLKIFPLIDLDKINELINDIPFLSNNHKLFYKTMLKNRYEKILKGSYIKLIGENK